MNALEVNIGRVGQNISLLGNTITNYLNVNTLFKTNNIQQATNTTLTIGDNINPLAIQANNISLTPTSHTTIGGGVKMPNLSTNNFIYRKATGTQSVVNYTSSNVLFTNLISSANTVGITYNDITGLFTNTSVSTVICYVSYTIAYPSNTTGIRNVQLFSSNLGVLGISEVKSISNSSTILNASSIVSVPSNATFVITCFQNSGVALILDNRTCIQVLVL
jgi:hypothetical protein